MIVAIHQPNYLPWLGYFHKIAVSDVFVTLDSVQFERNSFTNRNKIKTAQGPTLLTIPVLITGHIQGTVADIEINNTVDWRKKHWKSIYFNYKKAPFFREHCDFLDDFFKRDWTRLCDAIEHTSLYFLKELGIDTVLHKLSQLPLQSKKQHLVLDLCTRFKAAAFVFGALGKDYADVTLFEQNNVRPVFQDYKHPSYQQLWGDFVSHLSIIDLLFNVGRQRSLEILMSGNITKQELKGVLT